MCSALDCSAIPHTKMEWGHYTSGSETLPADTHMLTYTCTDMHARTCSHAHRALHLGLYTFVFARTDHHTHTPICDHTHQTRLCCHHKKLRSGGTGRLAFHKGSELTANYSWWPTKPGDGSQCTLCLPTHLHPHGWERRQHSREHTAIL